jgi:hypothetical protein
MNAVKMSLVVLAAGLGLVSAGTATAQNAQRVGPTRPKVVSKSRQPVGTPHKASSFAPHPTTRRVFGAPIQPAIVHNVPTTPPKKSAPK